MKNKGYVVLYSILLILFFFFPILSLPLLIFLYIIDKDKKGLFYSILIGVSLGIISYYYVPKEGYDLIKNHNMVLMLQNMKFSDVVSISGSLDLEFIPVFYSYFISFFNNVDLLQFFVVSGGYSILFYMLYDYRKKVSIDNISFFIISLFIFFGFNTLYFISGLYCYLAFIIFSFVFYSEYVNNKNSLICSILYILLIFVHNSLLLPVAILFLMKLLKNKFNIKIVISLVLLFVSTFYVLTYLNTIINSASLQRVLMMYNVYTENNDHYKIYYSGIVFFIEISKLVMTLLCSLKNQKKDITINYIFSLSLITILMMIKARLAIRYIMIIQFIGMVPIMNVLKEKKKYRVIYLIVLVILTCIYMAYFIKMFSDQSFGNFFDNKIYKGLIDIFNK